MAKKKLTKSDILKENLIKALEKSLGIVTSACRSCECSRETFYKYCREDPVFKKAVEDIDNIALDFAESQLHLNIQKGRETSIIFYMKTKGKRRGYVERMEMDDISDRDPIEVTILMPNSDRDEEENEGDD